MAQLTQMLEAVNFSISEIFRDFLFEFQKNLQWPFEVILFEICRKISVFDQLKMNLSTSIYLYLCKQVVLLKTNLLLFENNMIKFTVEQIH